jgi:hypothetical protein
VTYKPGDLVKFVPEYTESGGGDASLVGMVGMVLSTHLRKVPDDEEYLPILWADGATIATHLNDLQPVDWLPCVGTKG